MCPKDADGMANSADPDQTAPLEQSDLGLNCLVETTGQYPLFCMLSCTIPYLFGYETGFSSLKNHYK